MFIDQRRNLVLKFGDIVKVKFDHNKPSTGMILSRNSPHIHVAGGTYWKNVWRVKSNWFKFTLPKKLESAHGILVEYNYGLEYFIVYFPRLLKSGASCVLDIEPLHVENHTDIIEAKRMHKYILELSHLYAGIDNFGIIESLARHKHGHV